jgi:hypothetical protein
VAEQSKYLEYLDKEMTIMGILSTFCLAAVALVLDRVGGAEPQKKTLFDQLWRQEHGYVLLGSVFTAVAGAMFYKQRSALAWFYGQITLSIESPALNNIPTEDWYRDADSWATWIPYQIAFTALTIGGIFYLIAFSEVAGIVRTPASLLWVLIGSLVVIQTIRMAIYYRHKYEDDPIGIVFPILRR